MSCESCAGCTSKSRAEMFEEFKEEYAALTAFKYSANEFSKPTSILLSVTNQCNLHCNYCFVKQNPQEMTLEVAEKAIAWIKKNQTEKKEKYQLSVNFFGGEPLLKFEDIIKPIVEKYHEEIQFGITTNGVLLNEDIVDFFYQYNVNVLLSFDGVPEVQNKQRSNSFNKVLNNIPYLLLRFPKTVMRSTITKDSIPYLYDTVLMAQELGFRKICFCPNAYEEWDKETEKELENQFNKIGLYIYKNLKNLNTLVIQVDPLNKYYSNIIQAQNKKLYFNNSINRCGLGTTTCAICPNGDIVPCQEKTSCPTTILGNVDTGINPSIHKQFLINYFENVNSLSCDKGCDAKSRLNCISSLCPSRMEDLNYKFSTSECAFVRMGTKIAAKLHLLCASSSSKLIKSYFGED